MSIFEKKRISQSNNLKVNIMTLIMLKQSRADVEGFLCVCFILSYSKNAVCP